MVKVYLITSGKGGVGKTTSTINLGAAINQLGEEVTIVDANLTTPNIGLHLGAPIVPITLNHVINNKAKVEDAIYEHESGLKILPSSLSLDELRKIDYKKLSDVTKRLRKISKHILLDCSAGLGEETVSAIRASDELIIIANPEMSSVTDALKTIRIAKQMDKPVKGVIITRTQGYPTEMSIDNIKDMLEVPIMGIIPEDKAIKESQFIKNAVIHTHPKSRATYAYQEIAKSLIDPTYIPKLEPEGQGFLSRLLSKIGF